MAQGGRTGAGIGVARGAIAAAAAVAVCGAVVALAIAAAPARPPMPRRGVAVIAHRGGRLIAPENTLAAFRNAIALNCDYVEVDVRATADGQLVLMHDGTVDRTTDGSGEVARMGFAAIRRLDAGARFSPAYAGQKVPTLEEALALCRGRVNVYLDHKEGPIGQVVAALRARGMMRQVVVYDGLEELKEWKRLAPELPVMMSPEEQQRRAGGLLALEETLRVEVLDGHLLEWTPVMVGEAHRARTLVFVDCLGPTDNPAGWAQALRLRVDGLQTDHPDRLLRLLKTLHLRVK
jgi:glycerophosphoryl diester phosphodiesterase